MDEHDTSNPDVEVTVGKEEDVEFSEELDGELENTWRKIVHTRSLQVRASNALSCSQLESCRNLSELTPKADLVSRHVKFSSFARQDTMVTEEDLVEERLPTTCRYNLKWIIDMLVMAMLKYIFCIVGALIVHDDYATSAVFRKSLHIGIGVQCSSTLITCIITSRLSKIKINISGPDIISALFVVNWAKVLMRYDEDYALPTLLFLISFSTLLMGFVWYLLSYVNGTRIVQFLPEPVVNGFLGCIAFKVLKYAGKIALGTGKYEVLPWIMLFVSLFLGSTLFFTKRYHVLQKYGGAMIILPTFLLAPLVIFYIVIAAIGEPLAAYRANGVMFPEYENGGFWMLYTESYGQWFQGKIAWSAVAEALPDMFVMMVILVVDSLLKLAATKSALEMEVDVRYEMELTGKENIFAAFGGLSAPGYPQVKFNILSYGILGNKLETRVGYGVGVLCGLFWLCSLSIPILNVMPRFYLSSLLFYAAMPFIDNYLYQPLFIMKTVDLFIIFIIVFVVIVLDVGLHYSHAMLDGVLLGIVISVFAFVYQSMRITVIRNCTTGAHLRSKVSRSYWEDAFLTRAGTRVSVLQFDGFIFFASATSIFDKVKELLILSDARSSPERTRYFLFDFEHVNKVDESGIRTLKEVQRFIRGYSVQPIEICYTGLSDNNLHNLFISYGLLGSIGEQSSGHGGHRAGSQAHLHVAEDIDHGMEILENLMLNRAARLRTKWLMFDSFIKLHRESREKKKYELFEISLGEGVGNKIWQYAKFLEAQVGDVLCQEGEMNSNIFILQSGSVTSFTASDDGVVKRIQKMFKGAVCNHSCIFLNLPVSHTIIADEDSTYWAISKKNLKKMEVNEPAMALTLTQHILRHTMKVTQRLERDISTLEGGISPQASFPAKKTLRNYGMYESQVHGIGQTLINSVRSAHNKFREESGLKEWQDSHGEDIYQRRFSKKTLVHLSEDHHVHHFQHLKLKRLPSGELTVTVDGSLPWKSLSPHLSKMQVEHARKWFNFHLRDVQMNSKRPDVDSIPMNLAQRAIMDLGLFPTMPELKKMHKVLKQSKAERVDINEFLKIVSCLTLAELSEAELATLHSMFIKFGQEYAGEIHLSKDALKSLMDDLGHPEDEIELNCIMEEWDFMQTGFITFDAFISVVSTYLMLERLDEEMERDFLTMCGYSEDEIENVETGSLSQKSVTAESLIACSKTFGKDRGVNINTEVAEEMIFDSDCSKADMRVTFEELVTTLEMVGPDELKRSMLDDMGGIHDDKDHLRYPSGSHLSFK
jgi:SulP family sulfate permease